MDTYAIRLHGYGGQGLKSMVQEILAPLLLEGGHEVQAFPFFGGERRGALVAGYLRISRHPITTHSFIDAPDMVIVLDERIAMEKATEGLAPGGILLVATPHANTFAELARTYRVFTLDARAIAVEHGIGRKEDPFLPVNTVMAGAVVAVLEHEGLRSTPLSDRNAQEILSGAFRSTANENYAAFLGGKNSVRALVPDVTDEREGGELPVISGPDELCTKCRLCYMFCPKRAIELGPDDTHIIHREHCNSCGICVKICPRKAITVIFERRTT